jgi:diguanylate cyclase (GGDEF)-like protein
MNDFINYDTELKKMTILYVEDNPDERSVVSEILKRRVKSVIQAANGSEALLLTKKFKPDILLTDLMMPVMSGIELVQELKSANSDIEVIVASAYDKRSYFIDAINAGVNQYLLKPFAQNRLLEALYSCVKKIVLERNFHRQQVFVQTILDFQENIVIVTNGKEIIAANKTFLNFFGFSNLKNFKEAGVQITHYFSKTGTGERLKPDWVNTMVNSSHYFEVSAFDKAHNADRIFILKFSEFPGHKGTHIISFTDITELEAEHKKLQWKASVDPLTQIHNRDTFGTILSGELEQVDKYKHGIALILIAIKDLSRINEEVGIKKADQLLVEISQLIKSKILYKDVLSRWFGAEFVIMTFGRDKRILNKLGCNIKELLEGHTYEAVDTIEVDVGVISQEPEDNYDSLIKKVEAKFEHIHAVGKECEA